MENKFYNSNDMARLGCGGCEGCAACCTSMGASVQLNPYDWFELMKHLHLTPEQLLEGPAELTVDEGVTLPNLKMQGEEERCVFLNEQGRCTVYAFRPGLCRLFPLGRDFSDGGIRYFLLEDACEEQNRTKVKISKWLDVPQLARYEQFLTDWHRLMRDYKDFVMTHIQNGVDNRVWEINIGVLRRFYFEPYDMSADFYDQFQQRYETEIETKDW